MTKVRMSVIAPLAVLLLAITGCSDSGKDEHAFMLDAARLRSLDLTYDVPEQVHVACADAARMAKVRVVCPPLVPDVPLTRSEGLWGAIVPHDDPVFYMLTFNNGGLPGGKRHWIVGGGQADAVRKWALTDFDNVVEGDPELVRMDTVRGRQVSIYRYPPYPAGGPNGGHWAAFTQVGDLMVFASPHERRWVGAAVEMALALADELAGTS